MTQFVTITQTVHVPHNETVMRTWYNIEVRTLEREVDDAGQVLAERIIETHLEESECDLEEETLERDVEAGEEEIVEEEVEADEEDPTGG
jgi:hypothetical protein